MGDRYQKKIDVQMKMGEKGTLLVGSESDYGRDFYLDSAVGREGVSYGVAKELIADRIVRPVRQLDTGHTEYELTPTEEPGGFFSKDQSVLS